MKDKNVKGIIGLCLALASVLLIIISFIPMTKLTGFGIDGKISLYGQVNIVMAFAALVCAIAAIVFAVMAKKHSDKPGPRKAGLIIGIICILISLIALLTTTLVSSLTEYINNEGKSGTIYEAIKDDPDMKREMDDLVNNIIQSNNIQESVSSK